MATTEKKIDLQKWVDGFLKDLRDGADKPVEIQKIDDIKKLKIGKETTKLIKEVSSDFLDVRDERISTRKKRLKERRGRLSDLIEKKDRALEERLSGKRQPVAPVEGRFVVTGRLLDQATGNPLSNVEIKAFDKDRKKDDLLGIARTDEEGYYYIEYGLEQFKDAGDKKAETFIQVLDENEEILFQSPQSFLNKSGSVETIDVEVDGAKVPESLERSKEIRRDIDLRKEVVKRRKEVLDGRNFSRLKLIAKKGSVETRAKSGDAADKPVAKKKKASSKSKSAKTKKATKK